LVGLTVGGAIVVGTFPELLVGFVAGYIVYICHSRMVTDEVDQILRIVDMRLAEMEDCDPRRKQLEQLRTKAEAKRDVSTLGSSVIAVGAGLCPPAGLAYILGRWAWKQHALEKFRASIDQRIATARRASFKFC
jgi:hypothetical protein